MTDGIESGDEASALWHWALTNTHNGRLSILPSSARCTICRTPFSGLSGRLAYLVHRHPSSLNPHLCNYCEDFLPPGGAEVDVAVLFADVRGSTSLAENMPAREYSRILNRFYEAASSVLIGKQAVIDKLIGDEIMAFFVPSASPDPSGAGHRRKAVESAVDLMRAVGYRPGGDPWLPLAIGVNAGEAFVGKLGTEHVHTFTTIGDTINTAARLRSEAVAGEILLGEDLYGTVAPQYPDLAEREISVKGKSETLRVYSLHPGELTPAPA